MLQVSIIPFVFSVPCIYGFVWNFDAFFSKISGYLFKRPLFFNKIMFDREPYNFPDSPIARSTLATFFSLFLKYFPFIYSTFAWIAMQLPCDGGISHSDSFRYFFFFIPLLMNTEIVYLLPKIVCTWQSKLITIRETGDSSLFFVFKHCRLFLSSHSS